MPSTEQFGIWFPDDNSPVAPIQGLHSAQAESVELALIGLDKAAGTPISGIEARTKKFPNPKQGDSYYRLDKGWSERYYAKKVDGTNPGGRDIAGWYADAGTTLGVYLVPWSVPNDDFPFGDSPQRLGEMFIPDPGVPYRVRTMFKSEIGTTAKSTRWDVQIGLGGGFNSPIVDQVDYYVCDETVSFRSTTSVLSDKVFRGTNRVSAQASRVYGGALGLQTKYNRLLRVEVVAA
jgi:hypothetical protein